MLAGCSNSTFGLQFLEAVCFAFLPCSWTKTETDGGSVVYVGNRPSLFWPASVFVAYLSFEVSMPIYMSPNWSSHWAYERFPVGTSKSPAKANHCSCCDHEGESTVVRLQKSSVRNKTSKQFCWCLPFFGHPDFQLVRKHEHWKCMGQSWVYFVNSAKISSLAGLGHTQTTLVHCVDRSIARELSDFWSIQIIYA